MSVVPEFPANDADAAHVIAQLQQALHRARSTNQELALIADRVSDAILICDKQRCITWVNPAFTELTGFTLIECHGQQPEELLSGPHTDAKLIAHINQTLANGDGIARLTLCLHNKHGQPFWASRSIEQVTDSDGQVSHYIEVFSDLSHARLAHSERTKRLQAELALAHKTEFLARMGHNMRSSLNAILGFSQLLNMNADSLLPEAQRRQVGHIHAAGQQLLSLIDQAMVYAQFDAQAVAVRPRRIDLMGVLRTAQQSLQAEAQAHAIHIVCDAPSLTLWADPEHTQTIVQHLLDNAIKFSPDGATVSIQARASADQHTAFIEVKDAGMGIEPQQLERIFQPFTQLSQPDQRRIGNGLSLAVSQRLAALMHGHIAVHSSFGQGSVFTLQLPMAQAHTMSHDASLPVTPDSTVLLPPLRVVHVEDNALNRSLVEALFAAYPQVHLHTQETAQAGLACILQTRPDVALIDINLPDGSGLDLCQQVRQHSSLRHTSLIALSADALPDDIALALRSGFDHYLVKPLQIQRLLAILGNLPSLQASAPITRP